MELLDFYKQWLDWAEKEKNVKPSLFVNNNISIFKPCHGLCTSARCFDIAHGLSKSSSIQSKIRVDLKEHTGDQWFPFGGEYFFQYEMRSSISHLNKERISFVKKRIKALEKQKSGLWFRFKKFLKTYYGDVFSWRA